MEDKKESNKEIEIPSSYDVVGDIAILKFEDEPARYRKKVAEKLLEEQKNINTVVEKAEKVKGRLRTINTNYLAGEDKVETVHKESGCRFKVNLEECYFSPRLSNERLEVAEKIEDNDKVLVMFAGLAPYSIVIARQANPSKVYSVEIGRKCSELAEINVEKNNVEDIVEVIQGDVKLQIPKLKEKELVFDKIVMPRPQLKDTFLEQAFMVSKKGTEIIYYGFGEDIEDIKEQIKNESKKAGKKIKFLEEDTAGNIAPYRFR
ncbi:MAG: class I SAM-dependent methyltransferase, partial [Halanaerobiales bacterium]